MNFSIQTVNADHTMLLADMGRRTFYAAHWNSAPPEDLEAYMEATYHPDTVAKDIANPEHHYRLLYLDEQPVGYSKVVFNVPNPHLQATNIAKLDRLYLLETAQGKGLGRHLLHYNQALCQAQGQRGMWLFVWTGNRQALDFYAKNGFVQVGSRPFRLSPTHANPNFELYWDWGG